MILSKNKKNFIKKIRNKFYINLNDSDEALLQTSNGNEVNF